MARKDDVKQAERLVAEAEGLVREAGFDPGGIVTGADVENLSLKDRLHFMSLVLRKLQLADALLAGEELIPDPEDPDWYYGFKTNGTVLAVYEGANPIWHMERHGEEWKSYRLYISLSDVEDLESETPERRHKHVLEFMRGLERAHKKMKSGDHCFPNPFNADSDYRFGKSGNVMVAYRKDNPVWYLEREDGEWKTHRMIVSGEPIEDPIDDRIEALLREIEDDVEDFDEFDEFEGLDED
ncbi:MAG: hypothetical protein F4Y03_12870 [Alphaproteobacteria bacterium]|nr:hypothetical protein [Alphaproteobacteria bacterium]